MDVEGTPSDMSICEFKPTAVRWVVTSAKPYARTDEEPTVVADEPTEAKARVAAMAKALAGLETPVRSRRKIELTEVRTYRRFVGTFDGDAVAADLTGRG